MQLKIKTLRKLESFWLSNLILALVLVFGVSCAKTVVPDKIVDVTPSYDGNEQNSGFISFNDDNSAVITPRARDRYNNLAKKYGIIFVVPVFQDFGITPRPDGNFNISAEALSKFAQMNQWRKEGL